MKQRLKNISFYKRKPFYIVLIALFSLLLMADLAIAVFVPKQSNDMFGNVQNFDMDSSWEDRAGSGNSSSDEDTDSSDSSSDEDTDSGDMPAFDEDMDFSDMPAFDEDTDSDDAQSFEDFDFSEIQQDMDLSSDSGAGFLQKVKSHWFVIFLILFVLDGASIFMLLWICRKEKKQAAELAEEVKRIQADGEVHLARPEKKKKRSRLFWIIPIAVVILLMIVMKILTGRSNQEASETEETVYSETAELSDISTVLPGAGTLTEEAAEELTLASDVEISSWYVSNGDTVEEGDKLAEVDKVSVMTAIASVQETITELDEELAEHEDEAISDEIAAGADGRVMAIYAAADESVVDVMYENSSLMLLSLDGNMAVDIETDADISVGDSVDVTLADDTVISGKVESITNETAVIIVSDEDTSLGEEVSVATEDGESVGSGILYIHSELKVTGFTGTIEDVEVSVGDEVSEGDTLISLDDTEYAGEYETLLAQRNELEEQMQELFGLYQDGYIYASCSGVISGIESDSTTDDEATDDSTDADADISDAGSDEELSSTNVSAAQDTDASAAIVTISSDENTSFAAASTGFTKTAVSNPGAAARLADSSSDYINYIGIVTAVNDNSIEMKLLSGTYTVSDYSDLSNMNIDEAAMTETASFEVSSFKVVFDSADGALSLGSASEIRVGDTLILAYEADDTASLTFVVKVTGTTDAAEQEEDSSKLSVETEDGESQVPDSNNSEMGDTIENDQITDMSDADNMYDLTDQAASGDSEAVIGNTLDEQSSAIVSSGASADADVSVETEETEASYSIAENTLFSITPQETMTITITVDELDILSLEKGQEALVTLDAFPGQSFEGTVTDIDTTGTNSGGSTKFTAEVTIERDENMLAGMNASVVITLDTKESVLSIPEAALVEEGGTVYVYTSYDEDTETFGDLVEVTTGVSDGENVEILSGLEEGSEFYYSYLDVVNYSSSTVSFGSVGFSMESLFGGGR